MTGTERRTTDLDGVLILAMHGQGIGRAGVANFLHPERAILSQRRRYHHGSMSKVERTDEYLLFHAGSGEWYNQPHDELWDMGEDVADIPPAAWHLALEDVVATQDELPATLVVDVSEMIRLVGQDWGFLIRLSDRIEQRGIRLAVMGTRTVVRAGTILGLDARIRLSVSLDGALGS